MDDLRALIEGLRKRILVAHGGTGSPMLDHWNLTERDSLLHKATADALDRLAAVEKQRDEWREIVLWVLWGHQGFNSAIGLPLRALLRYGRSTHLSVDDLNAAKRGKAQIDAAIAARKGEG